MDKRILAFIPVFFLLMLLAFPNLSATRLDKRNQISHSVPLNKIVDGGPPPDGIPSIDHPNFVSAVNATFLFDDKLVVGLSHRGEARAYPLMILVWHEIVNDVVGGTPVAVTYCPLCFSTVAFVRTVDGQTVSFGTSGKLYDNNLVMYDRTTRSLWSQIWGQAIAGNLTGKMLQRIPIDVLPWGVWKALYPSTLVLSENTGYNRPYGIDPYEEQGYYDSASVFFPIDHEDNRLPAKTPILGVSVSGYNKAYPVNSFNKPSVIQDEVGNQTTVVFSIGNGSARVFVPTAKGLTLHFVLSGGSFVDEGTGTRWNYDGVATSGPLKGQVLERYVTITAFWFAWAAFYPNTSLYGGS